MPNSSSSRTVRVVVTCSDRKTRPIPDDLRMRSVSGGPHARVPDWTKRLDAADATVEAGRLYAGEHWAVVQSLTSSAPIGWRVELWVASAGYGLIPIDASVAPYAATFASGQPDSVVRRSDGRAVGPAAQEWWDALATWNGPAPGPRSLGALAEQEPTTPLLIACSVSYLQALASDIDRAAQRLSSSDLLSVACVGQRASEGGYVLPADARLTHALGGTRVSINARVAAQLVSTANDHGFHRPTAADTMQRLLDAQPALVRYERATLSDEDVRTFIEQQLHEGDASASALLRRLRDSHQACEQSRFRMLYRSVTEGTSA